MGRLSRSVATSILVLLAASAVAAPRPRPSVPQPLRPFAVPAAASTPAAAVRALARAYGDLSLPGLDALLSADFRFHFSENDSAGSGYADGFSRQDEMNAARGIFSGIPGRPAPDSLQVVMGPLEEGVDPEHPDSTCQYRVVVAHDFGVRLVFGRGDSAKVLAPTTGLHVFHVVRGDAAVRTSAQPADTTRWYLRRWLEDLDAVTIALSKIDGECSGDAAPEPPATAAPAALGLRAIGVPLCPTLKVLCDLPGNEPARLEVFDIQGRRLADRTVRPTAPGSVLVEAGNGQRFTPGAYWVRLTQGSRRPVTKLVMVAR